MSNSGIPRSGVRTQSISESETDRISSAVLVLDSNKSLENQNKTPTLDRQLEIELTRSSPNISPPGVVYLRHPSESG